MLQSASHWTPGLGRLLTLSRLHLRVEEGAPGPLHGSCGWLSGCGVWSPPHAPLRGAAWGASRGHSGHGDTADIGRRCPFGLCLGAGYRLTVGSGLRSPSRP